MESLSSKSPLNNFSWARVYYFLTAETLKPQYFDDYLCIEFLFHQHCLLLDKNGYGILYNPWFPESKQYRLLVPTYIQRLVIQLWDAYKTPIPINPNLN